jgi:hypothetical protein
MECYAIDRRVCGDLLFLPHITDLGINRSGIAVFGLQLITTVCLTYAVESQAALGAGAARNAAIFTAFWRQLYAFTAPFYYVQSFESLGLPGAGGLYAALACAMVFPLLACMIFGKKWRRAQYSRRQ